MRAAVATWLVAALFAAACADRQRATHPPAARPTPSSPRIVTATSLGVWYARPPRKHHFFDVSLHNPSAQARWLILPSAFPYAGDTRPAPGGNEVELQVFLVSERPRVVVVYGVTSSLWAVHLPGHGSTVLRRLAIQSWWESVPAATTLEVIVARDLRVGGKPLGDQVGIDPASETGGDTAAPRDAGDRRALKFWHPAEGLQELPVEIDVETRARIEVPLATELLSP